MYYLLWLFTTLNRDGIKKNEEKHEEGRIMSLKTSLSTPPFTEVSGPRRKNER